MTAETIARGLEKPHRIAGGWQACCPAHEDRSPSLSVRDAGEKVLVRCFAGCTQDEVIAALRSRGLWPERERRDWTPEERRDWARERANFERSLRTALYWRRAILLLMEEDLALQKAKLFDASEGRADFELIAGYTRIIDRLKRAGDEALIREYQEWRAEMPRQCEALVCWAQQLEQAEVKALAAYVASMETAG